jgi:ribonuclease G
LKREILINGSQRETRVAILEDDRLVELLVDRPDHRRTVGDIYLGRVEAVLPGIQAAFVDIGQEKSAFLHASDLLEPDEDEEPEEEGEGDGEEELEPGSAEATGGGEAEATVTGAGRGMAKGGSARSRPGGRCRTSRTSSRRARRSRSR